MKRIGFLLFWALLLTFAQEHSIWQKVCERYQKINTAQGSFHQNVCSESLGTCQEFIGWFYLKRPDKLRLDVTFPDSQSIIVSDNKIWFYFPRQSEVSEQEMPTPISIFDLFADTLSLTVTEMHQEENLFYLKLVTQDTLALIREVEFWVNPTDYTIKKFSYPQGPGTVATFELYGTKYNQKISNKIFEPPKPKKE
ncbi:MAG: outer membrane lipoprotein carrier protein LolA [candidate division WOR-3 bacterium]